MKRRRVKPLFVGIVGGSGSGKTWLAEKLCEELEPLAIRISQDDFYLDRSYLSTFQRTLVNYDHPRAIDWRLLELILRGLSQGRTVRIPHYDFESHSRLLRSTLLNAKPIVIIEGLWLLRHRSIRKLMDESIYVDCDTALRLRRRVARDMLSRGRERVSIKNQFLRYVEPMNAQYVVPQKKFAHITLKSPIKKLEALHLAGQLRAKAAKN